MDVNLGLNQYCGPAVLSIYTGCTTDDCADEISKINGQHKIRGVTSLDLITAGRAMGLDFVENQAFEGRSIFWAGSAMIRMPPAQYLVTIPKHFIAIEVRDNTLYICDNHTKQELELQNSSRLGQKIERVWKVIKVREYSRPHVVKTEFGATLIGMNCQIRMIQTMSDGGVKIHPLGAFTVTKPGDLQEVAFEIMKLTEVK